MQDLSIIECAMVALGNTNEVYAVKMLQIVGWHSYHFSMGTTLSQRLRNQLFTCRSCVIDMTPSSPQQLHQSRGNSYYLAPSKGVSECRPTIYLNQYLNPPLSKGGVIHATECSTPRLPHGQGGFEVCSPNNPSVGRVSVVSWPFK